MRLGQAKFIEVDAGVRYWEDGSINGVDDDDDGKMPLRRGDSWAPIIELSTGYVVDWPEGTAADIHYKVCDAGEYWLLDSTKARIAKWKGHYVPDDILCVSNRGYGDYIIMQIKPDGFISEWQKPDLDADEWKAI